MERPDVYCQNCRSQNSLRDTHCKNCGTRLLLVVFPQSLQYDTNHVPSFYEDHLLERVSLLELRLTQVGDGLRIAMEIIREQGKILRENNKLTKSLYRKINGTNARKSEKNNLSKKDKITQIIERAVAEHDSPNVDLFTKLLSEGVRLLEKNDEKEAFRMLERAVMLSPRNVSLLLFTARAHFFADKFSDAKKYLEKAFELAPDNTDVLFLLGVIYADEADTEKARLFLSILAESEKTSMVVNFVWGILAASEEKMSESIAAFKIAAQQTNFAELEYLLGCSFFEQKELVSALSHFQKAVAIDGKYTDAWFMQAVVYHLQADERAINMLANASELKEAGSQSTEFLRKNNLDLKIALPFQHFIKKDARLLTGGSLRLARFLKNEIIKAID